MAKKKKHQTSSMTDLRLEPEKRLCPQFDNVSIATFPVASRDKMGVRVVDNCAQEHIM